MLLKRIVEKSWYGTIGYISCNKDLEKLERFINYNKDILTEYLNIIVATNYSSSSYIQSTRTLWKKYFPNCILIDSPTNRGHNHGCADLDNLVVDYCKENNIEWLCKSANDILLLPDIFNIEIEEADFYYFNGIGYGGMVKYGFDTSSIISQDFYPQTNFYFINVSKIDYLNNREYLDTTYEFIQKIPNYNGKIWEYINGWSCEDFLKQCVERNNLSKYHLISEVKYTKLINYVKQFQIHDCSHKNIVVNGVCHFHNINEKVIVI